MLTIPSKIFLCKESVSMHKSFEGLGAIVEKIFPEELLTGSMFVFLNRQRNCLKALIWDRDGFVIFYKRLEKGSFCRTTQERLDRREFLMLLEGIEPKKIRPKIF